MYWIPYFCDSSREPLRNLYLPAIFCFRASSPGLTTVQPPQPGLPQYRMVTSPEAFTAGPDVAPWAEEGRPPFLQAGANATARRSAIVSNLFIFLPSSP